MSEKQPYPVSPRHMVGFGMIIQWFARHESLMQTIMSHLAQTRLANIMFMMSGLGYAAKRDLVLAFLKESELTDDQKTKIQDFMDQVHSYKNLRNNIAHGVWLEGKRPDSIKPMFISVRGGFAKVIGLNDNEPDYTPDELIKIADKLNALFAEFRNYLGEEGIYVPKER